MSNTLTPIAVIRLAPPVRVHQEFAVTGDPVRLDISEDFHFVARKTGSIRKRDDNMPTHWVAKFKLHQTPGLIANAPTPETV